MASTEFIDPYIDPGTGSFVTSSVHAATALVAAEGVLVFGGAVLLLDHQPRPTGDLVELRAIHRFLFQDLFDWAGQLRTVDIRKNVEARSSSFPSR